MFIARDPHQSGRAMSRSASWLAGGFIAGIFLSLLAQAWLIFNHRFSGDEFHFLDLVHSYLRGTLELPLQTLHVHLFAPLAAIFGSETEQLIAGRLAMLAFESASIVSLYLLARTWSGKEASLLAALAFATMPLTLQHAASFRTDPLALAPIMVALTLLARAPLRAPSVIAISLLAAVAFLVTVKVVFFAPAFAGIAAWRVATSNDWRRTGIAISAIVALTAVVVVSLYLLHQSMLSVATVAKSGEMLASASSTTILTGVFLPRSQQLIFAIGTAVVQSVLIFASIATLLVRLIGESRQGRWQSLAILGCIAPLLSLLFYRNAFVYFIPFISAPAFVAVAWFVERQRWNAALSAILAAGMILIGAFSILRPASYDQSEQRTTIDMVHRIFPDPVPYIDASGMIASFPREGFFMSGWGMAEYRRRPPIFENMLREEQIPLLLVNGSALEQGLGLGESRNGKLQFADASILRENYIPHWGPVWVAGKHVLLTTGVAQTTILVPGRYTVEGAAVTLDGREYRPGDTVVLSRGTHRLSGTAGREVILRWGNHLPRPSLPAPVDLTRGF